MMDASVVEERKDGSKKWGRDMVNLSMIDRETRRYAWKRRLETFNLARCFSISHNPLVIDDTSVKWEDRVRRAIDTIAEDMIFVFRGACTSVRRVWLPRHRAH